MFGPIWSPETELHIWGPPSPVASLDERIATYFSPPLFPVHLSEVPSRVSFHDAPREPWTIGSVTLTAHPILHPGATVGYRLESGDRALAYVTDHEPALGTDLDAVGTSWISGYALAHRADLLIHDCQYTVTGVRGPRRLGTSERCPRRLVRAARRGRPAGDVPPPPRARRRRARRDARSDARSVARRSRSLHRGDRGRRARGLRSDQTATACRPTHVRRLARQSARSWNSASAVRPRAPPTRSSARRSGASWPPYSSMHSCGCTPGHE